VAAPSAGVDLLAPGSPEPAAPAFNVFAAPPAATLPATDGPRALYIFSSRWLHPGASVVAASSGRQRRVFSLTQSSGVASPPRLHPHMPRLAGVACMLSVCDALLHCATLPKGVVPSLGVPPSRLPLHPIRTAHARRITSSSSPFPPLILRILARLRAITSQGVNTAPLSLGLPRHLLPRTLFPRRPRCALLPNACSVARCVPPSAASGDLIDLSEPAPAPAAAPAAPDAFEGGPSPAAAGASSDADVSFLALHHELAPTGANPRAPGPRESPTSSLRPPSSAISSATRAAHSAADLVRRAMVSEQHCGYSPGPPAAAGGHGGGRTYS